MFGGGKGLCRKTSIGSQDNGILFLVGWGLYSKGCLHTNLSINSKNNVHFTRRATFSHRFRGLRLVYGNERNEIVNLKFVTRELILFCLPFFCPLKKCERGNFCEGAGILVSPNEFISVELFLKSVSVSFFLILTWLAERDRSCHVTIFVQDIFLKLVIFKPFFPSSQVGVVVATAIIWKKYMSEWWLTDHGWEESHERMHNPWLWSKRLTDHVSVMWYNVTAENTIMLNLLISFASLFYLSVNFSEQRFSCQQLSPYFAYLCGRIILCFLPMFKGALSTFSFILRGTQYQQK